MTKSSDTVTTFDLVQPDLRGRIVRMGGVLDEILDRHEYPAPIARLTAETVLLTALLSSMLKYEGVFTLQAQGSGPVSMVVADMTSQGVIRGCATVRPKDLNADSKTPFGLLGTGHLAFTVDQAGMAERYQGIVELKGKSLTECVQHYFKQSEQIMTGIYLALSRFETGWRGGAIMLQRVPGTPQDSSLDEIPKDPEESWRRVMTLLQTCTDAELLDPQMSDSDLLFRLFHEEGIRLYDPSALTHGCRCNPEKVTSLLQSMTVEELDTLAQDGRIIIGCEFCGRSYNLLREEIQAKGQKA